MILIIGTTASGKNKLAFDLACQINTEIISVDSMKVYRRMDIGTAKPPLSVRQKIKYHLIDVVEPSESFSVGRFLKLANSAIDLIKSQNKPIIAVGGTALYIKGLLYGLFDGPAGDEKIREELKQKAKTCGLKSLHDELAAVDANAAERIHPNDQRRIIRALEVYKITGKPLSTLQQQWNRRTAKYNWKIIGLRRDKQSESRRINKRVKKMLEAGLVDEVKRLLAEGKPLSKQARSAIGCAEIIQFLNGKLNLEDATELIKKNTRRLAKHQRTWFKTFENIHWLDIEDNQTQQKTIEQANALLKSIGVPIK